MNQGNKTTSKGTENRRDHFLMLNARYVMDGISDKMKHKRELADWN